MRDERKTHAQRSESERSGDRTTTTVIMSGGVTTRAQKRRTGERDVWDLIVNNDDVSFKHILPRLNKTDLKFLYEVNTETRKLIKRSSRKGDLKEKFKVKEMSSISTLEIAWENKSLCPRWWDEEYFCLNVAKTSINRFGRDGGTNHFSAKELLKRINSSCSSGCERRKSVSGIIGRLMRPHIMVIWKW